MKGLDYEIVMNEGQVQLWTPDWTGAILGIGTTEREAKDNSILNMLSLCEELKEAPKHSTK